MTTPHEYEAARTLIRKHETAMFVQFKDKLRALLDEYRGVPGVEGLLHAIDRAAGFDAERNAKSQREWIARMSQSAAAK